MITTRLSLVFLVFGFSMLLGLWAMGLVSGQEVPGTAARTALVVAIGGVASSLGLALLGRRPPPAGGDGSNPPRNGPQF